MNAAAIIQARMGSTRLPGKVLRELCGRPMLEHVVRRVQAAERVDSVCVATTTDPADDAVAALASEIGAAVFRGSEDDVLSRYVGAADMLGVELVVRITADCPLCDPSLLDEMLAARDGMVETTGPIDYYSNTLRRTYPRGLDAEIVPASVLRRVADMATDPRAREHVTWHIYQHPREFRLENHAQRGGRDDSALRWTVDAPQDFEFVRLVYEALYGADPLFDRHAVLELLERRPELAEINRDVEQKRV